MDIDRVKKEIAEFEALLKPITPDMLTPESLAKKKALRIKAERAKQREYSRMQKFKGKKILDGAAASPGIAAGVVRNVHKQDEGLMAKIELGEILVADRLTPEHDVYMRKAAAFVQDTGGMTCSTAIVARELDKPAVTATIAKGEEATRVLRSGQKVVVDGTEGAVYRYVEPKSSKPHKT